MTHRLKDIVGVSPPESGAFHFVDDSFECRRIVEGKVGKHLAVDLDTCLVDETHELRVAEILHACCGVDALDPESAEVALLILAVAVSVCETFFPSVLGNGPYITAAAEVSAGEF